jgi:hypothetical protein
MSSSSRGSSTSAREGASPSHPDGSSGSARMATPAPADTPGPGGRSSGSTRPTNESAATASTAPASSPSATTDDCTTSGIGRTHARTHAEQPGGKGGGVTEHGTAEDRAEGDRNPRHRRRHRRTPARPRPRPHQGLPTPRPTTRPQTHKIRTPMWVRIYAYVVRHHIGAACGNRTHDLRITRTTGGIPGTPTSTDRTSDATESTWPPGRTPTEMPERMPTPTRRAPQSERPRVRLP